MTRTKYIVLLGIFLLTLPGLKAQQIKLLDFSRQTPVREAAFKYGDQKGITGKDGSFTIRYYEKVSLEISHINYGKWLLSPAEVKRAVETGVVYKEEVSYSLQPVTVVAIHTPVSGNSVLALSSRDRLAHDGGDLLNNIEGFSSIRKSGAYGFDPVFRGFKYDQLNVVIDGAQSASAACPNRMDPPTSQVAPNMISHIEVQKGPHSLRYGNAFGATINYVPAAPQFSEKQHLYGRLTSSFETNGTVTRNEGTIGISAKKADLRLFGSFAKGTDYKDGDGNTVPADFMRASAGAMLGLKISDSQTVSLSATRNFARDTDFPALPMDLRSDDTWLLNAKHRVNFRDRNLKSWGTTIFATFVDHHMDNLTKTIEPRIMNANTPAKTKTYGGKTEGSWQTEKSKLFAGADLRIDKAEGKREREFIAGPNAGKVFYDNVWQNGTISKSALFAEYQLSVNTVSLIFSGRFELNQSGIDDAATEFSKIYENTESTQLNPSVSLGAVKHLRENFSLGLWLGRAQRSGNMTERFINYLPVGQDAYELLGNPELNSEVNNEADMNLSYKTEKSAISLDFFASLQQDYISSVIDTSLVPKFPTSPGVRRFTNIDNAFKTGFELSWNQTLTAHLQHRMAIAYTYGQNIDNEEPLPEIAPLDFRYTLTGSYLNSKLRPSVTFRHVLSQERVSADFGEKVSPAFTLIDLNVLWQITKVFSATAGIQNLLDEAYYEHLNRSISGTTPKPIYAPGRNIFLSLTMDLF
ncbi:MAG: TonB-dependent receptor [Lentimicrobium sp.]|nr:TonB-dependent receptor [Lentimicrobium sp.]